MVFLSCLYLRYGASEPQEKPLINQRCMTSPEIRINSLPMDDAYSQGDQTIRQTDDRSSRRLTWRASPLALLLPGLAVALGYAGLWLYLMQTGRAESNLARISLLVLVIGVPCLLAHAGLRLSTTRLTARGAHLEAHPGFPARDPLIVAYPAITGVRVKRGLSGWLTGAGSLVIERDSGSPVVVSGLGQADSALAEVKARSPALNGSVPRV
jgi:hypothetical protein